MPTNRGIVSALHFDINRPIHLARRDAFFERAAERLYQPVAELDATARLEHVSRVLQLLSTAQQHATFATRSAQATGPEQDFLHFLRLVAGNLRSVHSMTQHQEHLEGKNGFLCRFLNAPPEECALPAMHYRRRADDILQGIWHLLRLAHEPYRTLQQASQKALSPAEQERYRKAYQSFRQELQAAEAPQPAAPPT